MPDKEKKKELIDKHQKIMDELQEEWREYQIYHQHRHGMPEGIRSSQISAFVMYLVKKGVL